MSFLPSKPNASLIDVFKLYPELARPLHEFSQALMRGPSPFSEGDRELIAAYVSALNGCDFCRESHTEVARHFGVAADVVQDLVDDLDEAPVREELKPVLRYVRKLNDAPDEVTQADVNAVFDAGWDETALVHAALVCGQFNLMNRWVEGLGIEADPAVVRMAGEHLHARGYKGIVDLLQKRAAQ